MRKRSRDQNFEKNKNSHHLIILKPFKTKGRFQNPFDQLSKYLPDHPFSRRPGPPFGPWTVRRDLRVRGIRDERVIA